MKALECFEFSRHEKDKSTSFTSKRTPDNQNAHTTLTITSKTPTFKKAPFGNNQYDAKGPRWRLAKVYPDSHGNWKTEEGGGLKGGGARAKGARGSGAESDRRGEPQSMPEVWPNV